jgi:hypothetical protein
MLTIRSVFSAFQVKAIVGLEPGKQCAELSDRGFERKRPTRMRTKLPQRPFTSQGGYSTLGAA